jgi:hypothetical protein
MVCLLSTSRAHGILLVATFSCLHLEFGPFTLEIDFHPVSAIVDMIVDYISIKNQIGVIV